MSCAKIASSQCGLLILIFGSTLLFGQANPHKQLQKALLFEKQQRFDEAVATAKSAIESNELRGAELGRAYIELGFALRMNGQLIEAQVASVHAIRVLENDRANAGDYASALDNYAALYSETGQIDLAFPIWLKALHLRQNLDDHEGIAHSLVNLAGVALGRNRVQKAKEYLQQASDEMKLTTDLTDDDLAVFDETQGWLAMVEGNPKAAVDDYRRALELCEREHGEEHWLVGWERMLRGRAYFQAGDKNQALADMSAGLATIGHALGRKNPKYVLAELAYSQALDQAGLHTEAAQLRAAAQQARRDFSHSQCIGCTIDASASR